MSGREKVGHQNKSSNLRKDERNLEEKKERDLNNKTRKQAKVNKVLNHSDKDNSSASIPDGEKSTAGKGKIGALLSRRKPALHGDGAQTSVNRRSRNSDDVLDLNTELIKRSPTIIDKLINKNKSAIQKSRLKQRKANKSMPEKSTKQTDGRGVKAKLSEQNTRKSTRGLKSKSASANFNANRKKIDRGKLLASTIARKKLKASQARIGKSAKKRLLRSGDPRIIANGLLKKSVNNITNNCTKPKENLKTNVKLKKFSDVGTAKQKRTSVKKESGSENDDSKTKGKESGNNENKNPDVKDSAGPSSESSDPPEKIKLRSDGSKVLHAVSPVIRPVKKHVTPLHGGLALTRLTGRINRPDGQANSSRRGRSRGSQLSPQAGSPIRAPVRRSYKRQNCDSPENQPVLRRRRRNVSNECNKSDSLADDQSSYATDSEFSFPDSASTVTKLENIFDMEDFKIKTEIPSSPYNDSTPLPTEVCSNKGTDSNFNLFKENLIETSPEKSSVKLGLYSPTELHVPAFNSSDSREMSVLSLETLSADISKADVNESEEIRAYNKDVCKEFGESDSCTSSLNSKVKERLFMKRRLSSDSKSDSVLSGDISDCDMIDKDGAKIDKSKRKVENAHQRRKADRSLWVRRSVRGLQKNADSSVSDVLNFDEDVEEITEKETLGVSPMPHLTPYDCLCDSKEELIQSRKSADFDPALDFSLLLEDSPQKTETARSDCYNTIKNDIAKSDKPNTQMPRKKGVRRTFSLDSINSKFPKKLAASKTNKSTEELENDSCLYLDGPSSLAVEPKDITNEVSKTTPQRLLVQKEPPPLLVLDIAAFSKSSPENSNVLQESCKSSVILKPKLCNDNSCNAVSVENEITVLKENNDENVINKELSKSDKSGETDVEDDVNTSIDNKDDKTADVENLPDEKQNSIDKENERNKIVSDDQIMLILESSDECVVVEDDSKLNQVDPDNCDVSIGDENTVECGIENKNKSVLDSLPSFEEPVSCDTNANGIETVEESASRCSSVMEVVALNKDPEIYEKSLNIVPCHDIVTNDVETIDLDSERVEVACDKTTEAATIIPCDETSQEKKEITEEVAREQINFGDDLLDTDSNAESSRLAVAIDKDVTSSAGRSVNSNEDANYISDHSLTSSSFQSALTEGPNSLDSDALMEIGRGDKHELASNEISGENHTSGIACDDSTCTDSTSGLVITDVISLKNMTNLDLDTETKNKDNLTKIIANMKSLIESTEPATVKTENDDSQTEGFPENNDVVVSDSSLKIIDKDCNESAEDIANKESILSALGLQSLHNLPPYDEKSSGKSSKPDSNYTGTLKAVIKLNRNGDKKSGARKMFFKQSEITEKDAKGSGSDMLEYRICTDPDKAGENELSVFDDGAQGRKSQMKQRSTSLDELSTSNTSAFSTVPVDPLAGGDAGKDDKVIGKDLVIPEKSSSFSIHPGRLCSDICTYCFGKFGSLDTPCHLAQLKNAERQQKILANDSHLKMDSCLCDACYRYVLRRANCPPVQTARKQYRRNYPPQPCCVQSCTQAAHHFVKRKWLVKLKKSIAKKLDLDMDKNQHLPFPLCNQHYYWVDYFTVCGICKKRLTRNHMYALGSEANELNSVLKSDSIPVRLSDKLFLCKLCRYYSSLRLKYKDTSVVNSSHKLFLRSYRKKILAYLDVTIEESEEDEQTETPTEPIETSTASTAAAVVEDPPVKPKKRKSKSFGNEAKKRKSVDSSNKSVDVDGIESADAPQMIDYSYLETLQKKMNVTNSTLLMGTANLNTSGVNSVPCLSDTNEQGTSSAKDTLLKVKDTKVTPRIQVKIGNKKISIGGQETGKSVKIKSKANSVESLRLPGESELPLTGELKQEENGSLGRNGWEKYTLTVQFDKETKKLWNELQRPYGNQSSFLRHLVMLEKYWRDGSLVLSENADPRAIKYNERAKNRVEACERTFKPPSSYLVASSTSTSTVLATTSTNVATSSASRSVPEVVQIISTPLTSTIPMSSLLHSTTSSSDNSTPHHIPSSLLKLDNNVMWQKLQTGPHPPPILTLQQSPLVRPFKVVVSSVANPTTINKTVTNVILTPTLPTSKCEPMKSLSKPITMTLQQFQSFQKRLKKDIKLTSVSPATVTSPVQTNSLNSGGTGNIINSFAPLTNISLSSTPITNTVSVSSVKPNTTSTTALQTVPNSRPMNSTPVDTFIPLICDVRSLAGTGSGPLTNWNISLNSGPSTPTGASKSPKMTYFTPILPKLPNTLTVRHIVPSPPISVSVSSQNNVTKPTSVSVPLNSSVTIEKAPPSDAPKTVVPEKPSISVFREDYPNNSV